MAHLISCEGPVKSHGSWQGVQTSAKQGIQMPLERQCWSLQKLLGHLMEGELITQDNTFSCHI